MTRAFVFPFLVLFLGPTPVFASLLGQVPAIDTGRTRLLAEYQSDLWTSPDQEKPDPLRRYKTEFKLPAVNSDRWKVSFNVEAEGLRVGRPGLVIGHDAMAVNTDLRSQAAGFGVQKQNPAGGWISLFLNYESASNEPFKDRRDRYFSNLALFGFDPVGNWQFVVGANQSQNRGIWNGKIMPIGGFYFRPTGQFTVALGFPFLLVEWKDERTTLRLSSTLPSVEAVLERDFGDEFFYRFRTGLSERGYLHNDRIKDENRIFFEEKYLEGGTGLHLSSRTQAIFSLGYAFDRRVYEGTHIFDSSGPDRRIKNDLFGTLHLEFIL